MVKTLKLAVTLFVSLLLITMGINAAPQSNNKEVKKGFDQGKKLLDKSIKKDKSEPKRLRYNVIFWVSCFCFSLLFLRTKHL